MESIWGKFKRYFKDLNDKPLSDKYDGVINLIDAFIDGNQDFLLSTFDEYSNTTDHEISKLEFDEYTKKAIYRFILEFEYMFPNILSEEELIKRISNNLSTSITLDDLDGVAFPDELDVAGYYNPNTKRIYIDKNLYSGVEDSVLFHEFLHCITIKDTKDPDLESDFLTETFVSLMENDYDVAVNNSKKRSNNYITNYAKQLKIIFDDELYNVYINNSRDISPLFDYYPVSEYDNKTILHNFVLLFNTINKEIKSGKDTDLLRYANSIFEFNLALMLENYLKNNPKLSNYDKCKKINELFNIQKDPDIDLYEYMINKYHNNETLLNQFPDLRYIKDGIEVGKLDYFTKEKCENFNMAKVYGFTDIQDYKNNQMFVDKNVFYSYPSSYYKDLLKYENYYKVIYELKNHHNIDLVGYDLFEVYPEYQDISDSIREEMLVGADFNNSTLYNYRRRNLQDHQFMLKAVRDDQTLFIEKSVGIDIFEKKKIEDLISNCDSGLTNVLKEIINDGKDEVYISNTSKNIIVENDNMVNCYIYKRFKKSYGLVSYELNDIKCSIEKGYQKKI